MAPRKSAPAKRWQCTNLHGIIKVRVNDYSVQIRVVMDDPSFQPVVINVPANPRSIFRMRMLRRR